MECGLYQSLPLCINHKLNYRIVQGFYLANWRIFRQLHLKINICVPMILHIQITKFKYHQSKMRAISLNLMLTNVIEIFLLLAKAIAKKHEVL